jgi:hypothetical protein
MSEKNGGGAAFARPAGDYNGTKSGNGAQSGMTLRDYFAAKAMQALLDARTATKTGVVGVNCFENQIAGHAYAIADAMIRARGEA